MMPPTQSAEPSSTGPRLKVVGEISSVKFPKVKEIVGMLAHGTKTRVIVHQRTPTVRHTSIVSSSNSNRGINSPNCVIQRSNTFRIADDKSSPGIDDGRKACRNGFPSHIDTVDLDFPVVLKYVIYESVENQCMDRHLQVSSRGCTPMKQRMWDRPLPRTIVLQLLSIGRQIRGMQSRFD